MSEVLKIKTRYKTLREITTRKWKDSITKMNTQRFLDLNLYLVERERREMKKLFNEIKKIR